MSDVKLICICNQFDSDGTLCLANFDEDTRRCLCAFSLEEVANSINQYAKELNVNDVLMLGDNKEYLKGIREQILYDYALKYSNEEINITILGE